MYLRSYYMYRLVLTLYNYALVLLKDEYIYYKLERKGKPHQTSNIVIQYRM